MPLLLKLQFTQLTRVKARRVRAEYSRLSLLKRRRTEICVDRVIKESARLQMDGRWCQMGGVDTANKPIAGTKRSKQNN
jgi:hypothetical protein